MRQVSRRSEASGPEALAVTPTLCASASRNKSSMPIRLTAASSEVITVADPEAAAFARRSTAATSAASALTVAQRSRVLWRPLEASCCSLSAIAG